MKSWSKEISVDVDTWWLAVLFWLIAAIEIFFVLAIYLVFLLIICSPLILIVLGIVYIIGAMV